MWNIHVDHENRQALLPHSPDYLSATWTVCYIKSDISYHKLFFITLSVLILTLFGQFQIAFDIQTETEDQNKYLGGMVGVNMSSC